MRRDVKAVGSQRLSRSGPSAARRRGTSRNVKGTVLVTRAENHRRHCALGLCRPPRAMSDARVWNPTVVHSQPYRKLSGVAQLFTRSPDNATASEKYCCAAAASLSLALLIAPFTAATNRSSTVEGFAATGLSLVPAVVSVAGVLESASFPDRLTIAYGCSGVGAQTGAPRYHRTAPSTKAHHNANAREGKGGLCAVLTTAPRGRESALVLGAEELGYCRTGVTFIGTFRSTCALAMRPSARGCCT
mmetsp:Transcript_48833/g.80244  ORF Transcript_48833/g.80244 Transcript_48833/m.80244 type:complete len:246 (-) Transcript_48833:137-874(-)